MKINKDIKIETRQYTNVNTPLAGMRERDRITGTFNQDSEDYFVISTDCGELEVSLGDWIVEFINTNGTLVARFVVPDAKIKQLLSE